MTFLDLPLKDFEWEVQSENKVFTLVLNGESPTVRGVTVYLKNKGKLREGSCDEIIDTLANENNISLVRAKSLFESAVALKIRLIKTQQEKLWGVYP